VACLENILTRYALPPDPLEPLVCVDEYPLALTGYAHDPLPASPGVIRREDYEDTRHGSCSLFGLFAPHLGWRQIIVRERRTGNDFAHVLQHLVASFPEASTIHLVLDNLNIHTTASLYATFPPEEAHRIASKLTFHYTPLHGSWLNQIEIEWSVLARQCLNRRLADRASVQHEVDAWATARNASGTTVNWHFTVEDARRCLRRLYPVPSLTSPTAVPIETDMATPL
jgi:transposase